MKTKIIRTSTVAMSLNLLLKGQLKFLSQYYDVIAVSGYDNDLEEVKEREKVIIKGIKMERKIAPLKDLITLYKLYKFFKKEKPTIVHSITPKAGLLSMIAAKYAGVPIRMHTFTGLIFPTKTGLLQRILVLMDKVLCFHATHVYPEGNGVKNDLIHYKITNKPLKVIANGNVNGIDLQYFNSNQITANDKTNLKIDLQIKETDFVFVFVGRLVSDKGVNELVEAFKKLNMGFSNAKLLLVGSLENELDPLKENTLNEIENNKAIISVGYQNDVRPYFAISNILVFPSYREGFPNVVMQAGAMGLPSIVSNINGCNEIVIPNFNGIIIPVKNTIAIFDAMKLLMENVSVFKVLQQNARRRIVENYEQQKVWNAVVEEYKRVENNV